VENNNDLHVLEKRIRDKTTIHNNTVNRKYELSVSIGILDIDPESCIDIQRALDKADKLMYIEKTKKKTDIIEGLNRQFRQITR